jgi:DNA ligase-4
VYGLKEKALANVFIKLIPLQKKDPDAQRMLFWKKPTDRYSTSGDFPQTLCEVVQKRSSVLEGTLTIQELNEILERLSKKMGKS